MIHTKSLIRRLIHVPWLLAIGLMLGWPGEAVAQYEVSLRLEADTAVPTAGPTANQLRIREEAGATEFSVTATITSTATGVAAAPAGGLDIALKVFSQATSPNPTTFDVVSAALFRLGGARVITIAEGKTTKTENISIDPLEDAAVTDTYIAVAGDIIGAGGTGNTVANSTRNIVIIDNDKPSTAVYFVVAPDTLNKGEGEQAVTATAFLNGAPFPEHKLTILLSPADRAAGDATATPPVLPTAGRDSDFKLTGNDPIVIDGTKSTPAVSASTTLNITPTNDAVSKIVLEGTYELDPAVATTALPTGATAPVATTDIVGYEVVLSLEDPPSVKSLTANPTFVRESEESADIELTVELLADVTEPLDVTFDVTPKAGQGRRDLDYDVEIAPIEISSGKMGTATLTVIPLRAITKDLAFDVTAKTSEGDVASTPVTITIRDDGTLSKNIKLELDKDEIYEGDGDVTIMVTALLDGKPLDAPLTVALQPRTVGAADPAGSTARRDVDYDAALPTLVIPAGQTFGTQPIVITPTPDDDNSDGETKGETIVLEDIDGFAGTAANKLAEFKHADDSKIAVSRVTITLKNGNDPATADDEAEEDAEPALALVDEETALMGTVGEEFTTKDLPEVSGTSVNEDSEVEYILNGTLPDGLDYNAEDLTISGTPTEPAAEVKVDWIALVNGTNVKQTYTFTIEDAPAAMFDVESVSADRHLLRERAGHATTITLTVTLAEAAATDTKVTLDFAGPSEGKTAMRDDHFTAQWDAEYPRIVSIAKGESMGKAKVSVTPINNSVEGATAFTVQATPTNGSGAKSEPIVIADDDTASDAIVLSVDPDTVKENDGSVSVTVTATLAGGKLDEAVMVTVGISSGSTATRDEDYTAAFESTQIEIAADASPLSGSTTVTITPIADEKDETGEVIELTGMAAGLATGSAVIALEDGGGMADMPGDEGEGAGDGDEGEGDEGDEGEGDEGEGDDGGMMSFAFAGLVDPQAYTAGTAIEPLVVPAAENGEGDVTYKVFGLPAGLAFDDSTRTISGTPEAATDGAVEVTVLATDSSGAGITLTISITVNAPLSFGDLFGAAKIVPDSHGLMTEIREFVIGERVEGITLPEGAGGTAPLTYSLSPALPAGLTFDAITRTISGTPQEASETVYTYTVSDASGASVSLALQTLPAAFSLADNFPNPFNPATTIQYALPQAADVELTVYNVLGQPIRTLVAEHQSAGRYVVEWDATNDNGHSLSSGMYFYRLQAGGEFLKVKKMLLLK